MPMFSRSEAGRAIIFLVAGGVLGIVYGRLSALRNQPNASTLSGGGEVEQWHWEPSPVWLPSYVACKFPPQGLGITRTRSGYLFRSAGDRRVYFAASTVVGMELGLAAGAAGAAAVCWWRRRRAVAGMTAPRGLTRPPRGR
jgi:hypothetical protein